MYHERSEIDGKVQRVVLPSVVQEHHVCDDRRLNSLRLSVPYPQQS
jgi:hypothetical protein